jgi:ABC-type phosphate transport system substrate-binding protein
MSRSILHGTAAVAALLVASAGTASAQAVIYGGGSTLGGPVYTGKVFPDAGILTYPSTAASNDIYYYLVGSGTGTTAFLNNSASGYAATLSGSNPPLPPSGAIVSYGASDAALSSTQISGFKTTYGYQLIQIPAFGTPIAVPVNLTAKPNNSQVALTDANLCGIFSGATTNWSAIPSAGTTAAIRPVYRTDGSGTTFLFTNHLKSVCTAANSSSAFVSSLASVAPTTSFAALFPSGVPSTFIGATGSGGVRDAVAGTLNTIGYVGPDYTKQTNANCGTTNDCKPVANVNGNPPSTGATSTALGSVNPTVVATNPATFDPLIPNPAAGYSIVGFTNIQLSSVYKTSNQKTTLSKWAACLYNATGSTCPTIVTDLNSFGFVPVPGATGSAAPAAASFAGKIIAAYFSASATVPITVASNGR